MPGLGSKGKGSKGGASRPPRSRNTTPGSVSNLPLSNVSSGYTAYLEISLSSLAIPSNLLYEELLERHGGSGGIPDSRHLRSLADDLKTLSALAENRNTASDKGIRELGQRRNARMSFDRETETLNRDAEEKARLKRAAEGDDSKESRSKRRKEQGKPPKEERPLAVGAHGVARQDGKDARHPSPNVKPDSGSSSPLSQLQSPMVESAQAGTGAARRGSSSSSSSEDSHQPAPAASIPQYQTFGTNPLTFDDPTIYHIRDIFPETTDDEKKEIYSVAHFPKSDLAHMMAGIAPDKDFSNAKPANQVSANPFQAYIDPYIRPLMEEDIAWLRERVRASVLIPRVR